MIAIPNMEKPKSCAECEWIAWSNFEQSDVCDRCEGRPIEDCEKVADFCPLIEIVQCKDCKWFELDVWGELNGIPVIVAHEMCKFWGNGCKTNPNAFCSYGERRDDE